MADEKRTVLSTSAHTKKNKKIDATEHASLSRRVFVTIFSIALLTIVVLTVLGSLVLQHALANSTRNKLAGEASTIAQALNSDGDDFDFLSRFDGKTLRITLVDKKGRVLFDNDTSPVLLSNHKNRPEISDALKYGTGSSERQSSTFDQVMMYRAVRLNNRNVVRLAESQAGVLGILSQLVLPLIAVALVLALLCYLYARRESRLIIAPLQAVDLDHPLRGSEHAYTEMVPMLDRIESQRQELKRQMRVLADNDRMRREFTANITHELKTPLTTISGYAELIANGMVADNDDLCDFGGRIYREAGRLTSLVNDILTLSNLDEAERSGTDEGTVSATLGTTEPVELARLIDSVSARLEQVAFNSDVAISAEGDSVIVQGVSRLLDEMVYNLASNAIRYNRPGGSVRLSCGKNANGHAFVCVADTGIGIVPEEQDKVFERFYRVDKSRSKARGGTGLGLAIVKHAAVFHHAEIDLQSELGVGTTITVTFPENTIEL